MIRRTLGRLDVSSRTLFALIEPGSCFAGTLLELALAADRAYMLNLEEGSAEMPAIALSALNFDAYPRVDGLGRLAARFYREAPVLDKVRAAIGTKLAAQDALDLGLVTAAPDEIDWEDEIRIAVSDPRFDRGLDEHSDGWSYSRCRRRNACGHPGRTGELFLDRGGRQALGRALH